MRSTFLLNEDSHHRTTKGSADLKRELILDALKSTGAVVAIHPAISQPPKVSALCPAVALQSSSKSARPLVNLYRMKQSPS
uniref:Uncharacterized protein n=1 Tax=Ditylenchus dipsaci TaxID=166011 RepID=A0A915ESE7_9BILA